MRNYISILKIITIEIACMKLIYHTQHMNTTGNYLLLQYP